jgi:uncharacterized membrane protein
MHVKFHPTHPMLVFFPLGLWITSLLSDFLGWQMSGASLLVTVHSPQGCERSHFPVNKVLRANWRRASAAQLAVSLRINHKPTTSRPYLFRHAS